MRRILHLGLVTGMMAALTGPACATVLCTKRSGVIVAREACKKKEAPLDIAQFGAVGSPGSPGPDGLSAWERTCPLDSVLVGTACVDKYEASVWSIPADATLVAAVKEGTATVVDLTAGGASEVATDQTCVGAFPDTFPPNGNWTSPLYAASVPGVLPAACVTWFQAVQACALSGKRLATNEEWQRAAAGTPGGPPCVVTTTGASVTGTAGCMSTWGAFDMVGNLYEWVADWDELATSCTRWPSTFGSDVSCFGGDGSAGHFPSALRRGHSFDSDPDAVGIFAVNAGNLPSMAVGDTGFRCVR